MTKNKCIHKYKRVNLASSPNKEYIVYKCLKPFCKHYIRESLVEGKECECYRCGELMIVTKAMIVSGLVFIHCNDCTKSKKAEDAKNLAEILKNI